MAYGTTLDMATMGQTNQIKRSLELLLLSADIGDHAPVGVEFEQRMDRYFGVAPVGLWTLMRQLANSHTDYGRGIDESQPIYTNFGSFTQIDFATLNTAPNPFTGSDPRRFLTLTLEKLDMDANGTEFINIDAMDPTDFSLNMPVQMSF